MGTLDAKGYLRRRNPKSCQGCIGCHGGTRRGNLYYLDMSTIIGRVAISDNSKDIETEKSKLWHMRLGHVEKKALQSMVRQGLLKGTKTGKISLCEHCILGK